MFQDLIFNHYLSKHVLEILFPFSLFSLGSYSPKTVHAIIIKIVLCTYCFKSKVKINMSALVYSCAFILVKRESEMLFSCLRFLIAKIP